MWTRRKMLQSLAGVGAVSLGGPLPGCLVEAARADQKAGTARQDERVLVLVRLAGGNDGLNTVIPYTEEIYAKSRPGIAIGKDAVLKLNGELGFHPAMTGLRELYEQSRLAIVQGVGYPNPNRSHFRSMDIWESARPGGETFASGWLGRAVGPRTFPGNTTPAMALGLDQLPLAFRGAGVSVPVIKNRDQLTLRAGPAVEAQGRAGRNVIRNLAVATPPAGDQLAFVRSLTRSAIDVSRRIAEALQGDSQGPGLPGSGLGQRLEAVIRLIEAGLSTRIYFVSLDGFDTHADQAGAHAALLGELSAAVTAFYRRLQHSKIADRVLVATYSEFGRRVKENGSLGTDHGSGSQLFVVTPTTGKAGLLGKHPKLDDLVEGDLKFHTDFRRVYATLLETWLGIPAAPVIGKGFPPLEFV